jgi:periplasmic protein TonB
MKFICLCLLLVSICLSLSAQTATPKDSLVNGNMKKDTSSKKKVEIESQFPGGDAGWIKFLNANLSYPSKAVKKNIQGTVVVQFIVDKDGSVSDIQATSGPDLLRGAAVDVLKKSPKWTPAYQDGKSVKSYKKQPINFRLQ